jgi:TonB family protein
MNAFHESFARASQWLWAALGDHLWQATLFAALVLLVTLLLRRGPARVRYGLWLVASAKFVVPSAFFAYLARSAGVEALWLNGRGADEAAGVPVIYQLAEPLSSLNVAREVSVAGAAHAGELYCALTLIWLAGCTALVLVWLKRRREFLRAVSEGREVYAGREFEALESAARRLGSGGDVRLLLSPEGVEPGVWRTRRPVILLPESIAEHLDAEELEALMLHELVHVERRDNAVGNLQMALSCLFWFHPLVWFMGRRLLAEREQACDERVLEVGGERGAYASSILKVVRFCFGWKVAGVSGAAAGSNLRRRIEKIMHEQRNPKASAWQRLLPTGAAALALVLSAGAGLLSQGQSSGSGGARVQTGGTQGSARVVTHGGGGSARVRTPSGQSGPATEEILNAPEAVVRFEHTEGSPLVFNDVKLRLITREQLRRADEEGADLLDEDGKPEFLVTLPTVTLTNVSGKQVKEVGIGFIKDGGVRVVMGYAAAIKPGEAQTFRSEWQRHNMIMPGTFEDVSVRVVWATFADGSAWGARPHAPYPPPPPHAPAVGVGAPAMPPPPPPPTARVYGVPGDGVATGIGGVIVGGEGHGAGEGAGGGVSSGGGLGRGEGSGVGEVRSSSGGGAGLNGQVISSTPPVYPAIARSVRAQGTVAVRVTVDEAGEVIAAKAVSGHPLLRSAAEEAARRAKFKPTYVNGQPVKVVGSLSYNFVLSGEESEPEQ